jgi:hypothetical protein
LRSHTNVGNTHTHTHTHTCIYTPTHLYTLSHTHTHTHTHNLPAVPHVFAKCPPDVEVARVTCDGTDTGAGAATGACDAARDEVAAVENPATFPAGVDVPVSWSII